jgi:hypothetical protein
LEFLGEFEPREPIPLGAVQEFDAGNSTAEGRSWKGDTLQRGCVDDLAGETDTEGMIRWMISGAQIRYNAEHAV